MFKTLFALTMIASSSALSAGTIGYISLASSDSNWVSGTGKSLNSQADADRTALYQCNQKAGNKDCRVVMTLAHENACLALARDYGNGWWGYAGWQIPLPATQQAAQNTARAYAMQYCKTNNPNPACRIESEVCSRTYDF